MDSRDPDPPPSAAKAAFFAALDARLANAEPAVSPTAAEPPPPPAPQKATTDAPELTAAVREAMGRLPFIPAPLPEQLSPDKRAPRTVQSSPAPRRLGATMPLDGVAQRPTPNLPFAGSAGGEGVVYVPPLDARQYVSLRAELALRPDQRDAILRRYNVPTEASYRVLEEHWRRPELRAAREQATETLVAWLRGMIG